MSPIRNWIIPTVPIGCSSELHIYRNKICLWTRYRRLVSLEMNTTVTIFNTTKREVHLNNELLAQGVLNEAVIRNSIHYQTQENVKNWYIDSFLNWHYNSCQMVTTSIHFDSGWHGLKMFSHQTLTVSARQSTDGVWANLSSSRNVMDEKFFCALS